MAERAVPCLDCHDELIQQHERSPGIWRPLPLCTSCQATETLTGAGLTAIVITDNSSARTRPAPDTQGWAVFVSGQEVRCKGYRNRRHGDPVLCDHYLVTVSPGTIALLRLRGPRQHTAPGPRSVVIPCGRCIARYELRTEAA